MDKVVLTNLLKRVSSLRRAEERATVADPAGDIKKDASPVLADSQTQIVPKQN